LDKLIEESMANLTKKEIALIVCALGHIGSDSDYWNEYKGDGMPDLMKRLGIKTPKECGRISDKIYTKLCKELQK
jgi:hypothetical protein